MLVYEGCLLGSSLSRYFVQGGATFFFVGHPGIVPIVLCHSDMVFGLWEVVPVGIANPTLPAHPWYVRSRCTQIVLNSRVPIAEKAASVVMDALGDLVLKVSGHGMLVRCFSRV